MALSRAYSIGEFDDRASDGTFRRVAIAVCRLLEGRLHVGVIYGRSAESAKFLHFFGTNNVKCDGVPRGHSYVWVQPMLADDPVTHRVRGDQVAAVCRLVAKKCGVRLPYGFGRPEGCFDENGSVVDPWGLGLTCASFALCLFEKAGWPLVQYDSWPTDRKDDQAWKDNTIKDDPSRVGPLTDGYDNPRVRPEEVAGACELDPPAHFDEVEPKGREILQYLDEVWGDP